MVFTKNNSSISLEPWCVRFMVKVIEMWSVKASVVWTYEILSLLDLVKTRALMLHSGSEKFLNLVTLF